MHIIETVIGFVDPIGVQGVARSCCCFTCNIEFEEQHALDLHRELCFDALPYASKMSIAETVLETVAVPGRLIADTQALGKGQKGCPQCRMVS